MLRWSPQSRVAAGVTCGEDEPNPMPGNGGVRRPPLLAAGVVSNSSATRATQPDPT